MASVCESIITVILFRISFHSLDQVENFELSEILISKRNVYFEFKIYSEIYHFIIENYNGILVTMFKNCFLLLINRNQLI